MVDVGFDPSYNAATPTVPQAGAKALWALVDTGATESHIDEALAKSLGLPLVDKRSYAGTGGLRPADVYLAQIHIPNLSFTLYGEFAGVDLFGGGQQHRALIGRTFLRNFTMIYEGITGTVTLRK